MLGSISPVGETSRRQRWWVTALAYTAASTAGGATVGVLLGAAGQALSIVVAVPTPVRLALLAAAALTAVALDTGRVGRMPTWRRQVDERWLATYRGWVYGAGFGFQLGVGVVTIVTSAATYAALAAAFLTLSWTGGLAVGATFGFARSVPLLAMANVTSADRLYGVTRRVAEAQPHMHRVTVATCAVAALATGAAAVIS